MPQGMESMLKSMFEDPVIKKTLTSVPSNIGKQSTKKVVVGEGGTKSGDHFKGEKRVVKRSSSCPLGRVRLTTTSSGPWSMEWMSKCKKDDRRAPLVSKSKGTDNCSSKGPMRVSKKKGSSYLRHCAQNLKCISRLSDKDRKEDLRVLRRTTKQRRVVSGVSKAKAMSIAGHSSGESQSSVNND
jgi:hypothetical protein